MGEIAHELSSMENLVRRGGFIGMSEVIGAQMTIGRF